MFKRYICLPLLLSVFALNSYSQQTAWFTLNQSYKSGLELLDHGKYAAASEQFSRVKAWNVLPQAKPVNDQEISLLKENAEYYQALCALELGNQDAESLFLKFISKHPVNPNTRMAYYQVGRSYFAQKKKSFIFILLLYPLGGAGGF